VIKSISLGDITRESYFADHPPQIPNVINAVPRCPPLRTGSGSLDEILQAREVGFGPRKKVFRREGYQLPEEEEERQKDLVAMMQSDPPSSDPVEQQDDEEVIEDDGSPEPKRKRDRAALGRGRPPLPLIGDEFHLGRATSLDLLVASSRAKHLVHNDTLRSVSGPSSSFDQQKRGVKHSLPPVPTHGEKRVRVEYSTSAPSTIQTLRSRDSFSRSQSTGLPPPQQTPRPHFTRSDSFSSASTPLVITPENPTRREGMGAIAPKPGKVGEADEDVLSAANSLIAMLGGGS
jgi:hypothetical protein